MESQADGGAWTEHPPVIKTISFKILGQDIDSVTKLDEINLSYATARNSNFRTDTKWNQKYRGAVLLTSEDFEFWDQWKASAVDNFKGSITVTTSDYYDETFEPSQRFIEDYRDYVQEQFTVVFFYKNFSFSGELNNCRFWTK